MLTDEQYLPVQHPHVKKRVRTRHGRAALRAFLAAEAHDVSERGRVDGRGNGWNALRARCFLPGTSEPVISQTVSVLHRPDDEREIATRTTPASDVLPRPAWFGASLAHASGQSVKHSCLTQPCALRWKCTLKRLARLAPFALLQGPCQAVHCLRVARYFKRPGSRLTPHVSASR